MTDEAIKDVQSMYQISEISFLIVQCTAVSLKLMETWSLSARGFNRHFLAQISESNLLYPSQIWVKTDIF